MAWFSRRIGRISDRDFSASSEEEKGHAVEDVIRACSTAAGAAALQPLPLLDIALIAPIQITMVRSIGRIRGYPIDMKTALEIFRVFHFGLLTQKAAISAPAMVPVMGQVLSMWVASALTYAVGSASDHYFRSGRTTPVGELKALFENAYRRRRAEMGGSVWSRFRRTEVRTVEVSIEAEPAPSRSRKPGGH
jgi:uncharacterized protein (DUF697 family)